ncbi:unnamed protein product [Paramecium pentaurelia]|uniref:Uncharacterized protein n=1 Tax=Paramecium pentaurelia TaxID=43138 RepID=A0A8S1VEK7_9CILI|nr:unnamed protein product [Paramecium pentaurelia]
MQESETNQVSQFESEDQSNPACPNKPIIPYLLQKSFVQKSDNASYLNWQQPDSKRNKSSLAMIGTSYSKSKQHECCDRFEQISNAQRKAVQSQIQTMTQLNQLILDHSKLLEDMIGKKREEADKNKSLSDQSDIQKEVSEKERKYKEWKEKCEKETQQNQQRDHKIKELKKKLTELEEQSQKSSYTISLNQEVETWKNKFLNLTKQNNETQKKLKEYEDELEQLKQNKSLRDSDAQQSTTTVTTTRKRGTVKLAEQIQQ